MGSTCARSGASSPSSVPETAGQGLTKKSWASATEVIGGSMSTPTLEHILQELEHLTPEERRRLREALDEAPAAPAPPAPDDRRARAAAWFAAGDELAARIGAAWKDGTTSVEAVREQRHDL